MALKIAVLYGSVRETRVGIRAAKALVKSINDRGQEATLVDPMEYELPLLNRRYSEYEKGKAPKQMEEVAKIFREADAFLVVCGEYNHSVPPALKNMIDHYVAEYANKSSAIVTYSGGPFGGVRGLANIRDIMSEVGTSCIPMSMPIPSVQNAFDENGKPLDEGYEKRVEKFLKQFFWHANALKEARAKGVPV